MSTDPDRRRVELAIGRLLRLYASRRVHADLTAAAQVELSRAGLAILRTIEDGMPRSHRELARRANMDPAALTRQIRVLEQDGLVAIEQDPADGRSRLATITPAGRAAVRRVAAVGDAHVEAALAGWSDADRATLAALMVRLVDDLQAEHIPGVS